MTQLPNPLVPEASASWIRARASWGSWTFDGTSGRTPTIRTRQQMREPPQPVVSDPPLPQDALTPAEEADLAQHALHKWTDVTLRSDARRVIHCYTCDGLEFEAGPRSLSWRPQARDRAPAD